MVDSRSCPQKNIFLHLARYNERVNREMYDMLTKVTDEVLKEDCGSWFGSLYKILNHIIVGDLHWLQRFVPVYPQTAVLQDPRLNPRTLSWAHDLHEDFAALQRDRFFVDGRIIAWFDELPEDRYGETFQYCDSAGKIRNAIAVQAFEFFFLHQMHHRGQISQILDTMGLPNNFADNGAFLEGPH